jgi:hypothetical protein
VTVMRPTDGARDARPDQGEESISNDRLRRAKGSESLLATCRAFRVKQKGSVIRKDLPKRPCPLALTPPNGLAWFR